MEGLLDSIPSWAGTVPQWGLFLLFAVAVVKTSPQWLTTWSTMRLAKSNRNASRIDTLEKAVRECREDCDRQTALLRDEIHGLRTQRNAEQAIIMKAILRTSNDPDVRRRLELLEAMEASLGKENVLQSQDGNVIPKTNGDSDASQRS